MPQIAEVLINIPVKQVFKTYTYVVPEPLSFLSVGWRVLVPFGPRPAEGFIMKLGETENGSQLKFIYEAIDETPWFYKDMIATAQWISNYYLCPLAVAMRLFIPGKSGLKISPAFRLLKKDEYGMPLAPAARQILNALDGRVLTQVQLRKAVLCSEEEAIQSLQFLLKEKFICKTFLTQHRKKAKFESYITVSKDLKPPELLETDLRNKPAQRKFMHLLKERKTMTVSAAQNEGFSLATIKKVLAEGWAVTEKRQILRDSYLGFNVQNNTSVDLNEMQYKAFEAVNQCLCAKRHTVFLLHGITGSGKTEIYIKAVAETRRQNRQAIILVPEIALTSQIVRRFKACFQEDVIVMHSKLSIEERNDAIERLRLGQAGVVIGARSAIFCPAKQIGLIVLDEEHEFAYKQEEAPRYHAREVAIQRAKMSGAPVILGSATPSVESYYAAQKGIYTLLELTQRIEGAALPQVKVVDMREELKAGVRKILSRALHALIAKTLQEQEQMIILLNRRGFSTFVLCRECGQVLECRHCAVPLVYHNNSGLHCHYCGTVEVLPDECPSCHSRYIRYFGTGTQKLEEELRLQFPSAKVIRMDKDTTTGKTAHTKILDEFSKGAYDILLGTQMVAKGHDFSKVTAVAVLSADAALNLPDFRSSERCFDLLTQAVGRAGRKGKNGEAIIQAYNPEHYAVLAAAKQRYADFYDAELPLRKAVLYPPYCQLLKITIVDLDEATVKRKAELLYRMLHAKEQSLSCEIIGPFAAAVYRLKDLYRMQLLIKSTEMEQIKTFLLDQELHLRNDVSLDIDPLQTS